MEAPADLVRRSCAALVADARLVVLDDDRLAALAPELATAARRSRAEAPAGGGPESSAAPEPGSAEVDASAPSPPVVEMIEAEARRVIVSNAVNFGSGYHDVVDKDPGLSGARTMAARLTRALDDLPVAPAAATGWLRSLTAADCATVFGQSLDHPEQAELMALFADALNQVGRWVAGRGEGSFAAVVAEADGSAQRLAGQLLAMPFYLDRASVPDDPEGRVVHFYKRAQITAADLARALPGWPPAAFVDLGLLTAFADNLVPHVLRIDGALEVEAAVVAAIDRGERLPAGGRAELELRAAGVEAVERLVRLIDDPDVRAMDLDLALWLRGGGAHYKAHPRHRTRCTFY
ncbi:MAG: queuosine salvage family protein [Actinomycetota bacterium]